MRDVLDTLSLIYQLRLYDIIDVVIVFFITYEVLQLVRGTRAVSMAAGVAVIALLYQFSILVGLSTLQFVLRNVLIYAPFAVIVLFQAEIRTALAHFGDLRNPFGFALRRNNLDRQAYDEIVLAATTLSTKKIGGLIVLERSVGLQDYVVSGIELNARLSYDLLVTIFDPHTPLHDGAVIIRDQQIAAASCFLPLTLNPRLSKDLGTRHRAAIGITEDSDAVAVVISEETGVISVVQSGQIRRNFDGPRLREALQAALNPVRREVAEGQREKKPSVKEARERLSAPSEVPAISSQTLQTVRPIKERAEGYDTALS